ncbi:phage tail protein [Allofournierella massiliensis]|uniref:Phage-related protein n=1 Tax=Allofournierella massiliensis TaxID=1650663 RepID=A0A4R1QXH0_9FIRM|nr:hypothetical protein [Fournierella massiliensis]TCL56444.1 hypothetical protein EDD77_113110 [Fournierella massiliensis]
MADGKVTISTALDNTGFKRGVNQVSGSLGGLRSVAGKLAAALAAAFAVQKVIQFGAACIQLGSDVAEVQNVVDVSFGGMAYKMEEFADTAITSFGMSELAAKKTGSTYMAMAKGMGVADEAASDMAISLTGLSGDVASFFNISQEDAAYKLRSIFTGETEALKDLGVVMTQANLQQYAMANGMNSNIQAMSQAERVALQYSFVMNSLKLAQGDFLRTQDSWANQTRILSMQWQQFMSIIGQALTTVLLPVVKMLNTIVAALINMANAFNAVITSIFGGAQKQIQTTGAAIEGANAGIASSAGAAAAGEHELADGTKAAAKAAKTATASIDELNVLQQDTGSAGSGGSSASGGTGGVANLVPEAAVDEAQEVPPILEKIKQLIAQIGQLFAPSIAAWSKAFDQLSRAAKSSWGIIQGSALELWDTALRPLGEYILGDFIPSVTNAFSETFAPIFADIGSLIMEQFALQFQWACNLIGDLINSFLLPMFGFLQQVIQDMFAGIKGAWDIYGQPILDGLALGFQSVRDILSDVYYNLVKPVLEEIMQQIDWLWSEHLKPLWDNLMEFFGAFAEMVLAIWNEYIYPWIQQMVDIFAPILAEAIKFVVDAFATAFAKISDIVSAVIRILKGLCEFVTGVFTGDWEKAWNGIKDIFGGVWDGIVGVLKGAVNTVIDMINAVLRAVALGVNAIIDKINALSFTVPDWVQGIGGETIGFNFAKFDPPQIPKLARGAVLPANNPFLAVVGDQRRGTNVEAPLETITQAVIAALSQLGGTQEFTASQPIEVKLDGQVLYRAMAKIEANRGAKIGGAFANAY